MRLAVWVATWLALVVAVVHALWLQHELAAVHRTWDNQCALEGTPRAECDAGWDAVVSGRRR